MSTNQGETTDVDLIDQFIDGDSEQILQSPDDDGDRQKRSTPAAIRSLVSHRFTRFPPSIVLLQLFLTLGWSRAAAEKVVDPEWWSGETVRIFIVDAENSIDWYRPFAESVLLPTAMAVSVLTLVIQVGVALSMASGRLLSHGVAAGIFLNLNFLALGEINPSVFYLVLQGVLVFWIAENSIVAPRFIVLRIYAAIGFALTVMGIPFVRTLDPSEMLDDTAIMIATGGILTALICDLTSRRLHSRGVFDFRRSSTVSETVE